MLISMIVAMGRNRVIGKNGQLPWHLPSDLQRFRRITMGGALMMGRGTFESIGHPLPGRQTIILSRDPGYKAAGCEVVTNIEAGLQRASSAEELFICGGEEVYRQTLALCERVYLTELDVTIDGETHFPKLLPTDFDNLHTDSYTDFINYQFTILQRYGCRVPLDSIYEKI